MKNKKQISLFIAVSLGIGLLGGCTTEQTNASVGSAPSVSTPSSSVPSSALSSSIPSSSAPSSSSSKPESSSSQKPEESSSAPASSAVQPPEDGSGQLTKMETGNADYDGKISKNPIDPNYIKESNEAVSTMDMIAVSDKYAEIWKAEIAYAYDVLIKAEPDKKDQYEKQRKEWQDGEESALTKIKADAAKGGGSLAEVDAASERMDYYRAHAVELFKEECRIGSLSEGGNPVYFVNLP